jgi:O-antigen/teichoic acid export membrane protein
MSSIRSAIVWASVGQYVNIAINFLATLLLARLLTPAEFGISSLGVAVLGIAEAIRELAGGTFLIRESDLTQGKIRSTTTVNILVTIVVAAMLVLLAGPLARFFEMPALARFLSIAVLGYMFGPLLYPQQALISREMAFDRLAIVNCASASVAAAVAIILAIAGFRANSFAWAGVASSLSATLICFAIRGDLSIYRPSLSHWRDVVGFGVYSSTTAILGRLAEAVPLLIFGRLLSASELAIGHRAVLLCLFPERLLLAAVGTVALPELSRQSREGGDLKGAYLAALSNITVVYWPVMVMLALLAQPVVALVLGRQWLGAVPLVRILSPALMLAVPIVLQFSILVAASGVQILPRLLMLQTIVTTTALSLTAGYGLRAAALSMLVAMPMNAGMSVLAVRSRIEFRWSELIAPLLRSAVGTSAAAVGPIVVSLAFPVDIPLAAAVAAVALGVAGWIIGLSATGHSLWNELVRAAIALFQLPFFRRQRSR